MGQDSVDVSLGLVFSLELLRQHQQTGTLRGNIPVTQFLKTKRYQCLIRVESGQVVSYTLIDDQGQAHPIDQESLLRIDAKKGPFNWTFYPQPKAAYSPSLPTPAPAPTPSTMPVPLPAGVSTIKDNAIPVRLQPGLQLSWLTSWQESEIKFLQQLFSLINGQHTVHDIKTIMFRFPPVMIERSLIFLIAMKQIEMRL